MAKDHDTESSPGTAPFVPDFSDEDDTGTHSWVPDFSDDDSGPLPAAPAAESPAPDNDEKESAGVPAADDSAGAPVQPVTVPGRYFSVKWWKLLLVILGVWLLAVEVGLGLFYWWYHATDKTAPVYVVLVYVVACTVGAVLLAMIEGRPLLSALSIALLSGPFASVAAAAPLDGYYHCARVGHCLLAVIPY